MSSQIRRFLDELDKALASVAQENEKLDLYLLGRTALILRYSVLSATRDVDIVRMRTPLEDKAGELFGKESEKAKVLGLYLDFVPQGLPPLPGGFQNRCEPLSGDWKVIKAYILDNHDLAITKMKSFRPKDKEDIQFLCDQGVLDPEILMQRLNKAFEWDEKDSDDRIKAEEHLQQVIRYIKGEVGEI